MDLIEVIKEVFTPKEKAPSEGADPLTEVLKEVFTEESDQ
jgi:hypothetical protein